jgi:LPXTG-motif cell wall-anchored protein
LPKTASSWPMLWGASLLSLAMGLALTVRRRYVR